MSLLLGHQVMRQESEEIDLATLLRHVLAYKWIILLITGLAIGLGILYSFQLVPQYQSEVLIQVDSSKSGLGQGLISMPLNIGAISNASNAVSTQIALILSPFILAPVIKDLGLDISIKHIKSSLRDFIFQSPADKMVQIKSFIVPYSQLNSRYYLVTSAKNRISLLDGHKRVILSGLIGKLLKNKSGNIRLQVDKLEAPIGTDFSLVKLSTHLVAKTLSKQLKIEEAMSKERFGQGTGILTITLVGPDPKRVARILNAVSKITRDMDAKRKSKEASQTLNFLYQQLPLTKQELAYAEQGLNEYRAKSGKIDIKLQTHFLLNKLSEWDKKLDELRINKIDMTQRYTQEHPLYRALLTQIRALQTQRNQLEQLLKKLPASDQIAVNLMREVKVKRTLYLILLNKIQELQVLKAGTISGVNILSKATIPNTPLPNKRFSIGVVSLLMGFILSAIFIVARRLSSPRIEDPIWSERYLNLPNVAIIPHCREQTQKMLADEQDKKMPLLAHINPKNLTVEALRSLRTSLQVSLIGADNNIVSILGVTPGIGKTFVSANLSYLLAAAGKKVLLIDADLRRGILHRCLNLSNTPGLAEILQGTISAQEGIQDIAFNENLKCITRGTYPKDPSELLMSGYLQELMRKLSVQFDVVVMDTAPILLVTDAVIVAGLSATNYLVLGSGVHQPTEVEMAIKRLTGAGAALKGSIFNFHSPISKMQSYGQYHYNNYHYSYYYDEKLKVN